MVIVGRHINGMTINPLLDCSMTTAIRWSLLMKTQQRCSNLCDQKLLDELNQQRRKKDDVFNDNAYFRIKALGLLLQERGYYYVGDGKMRKR